MPVLKLYFMEESSCFGLKKKSVEKYKRSERNSREKDNNHSYQSDFTNTKSVHAIAFDHFNCVINLIHGKLCKSFRGTISNDFKRRNFYF